MSIPKKMDYYENNLHVTLIAIFGMATSASAYSKPENFTIRAAL